MDWPFDSNMSFASCGTGLPGATPRMVCSASYALMPSRISSSPRSTSCSMPGISVVSERVPIKPMTMGMCTA